MRPRCIFCRAKKQKGKSCFLGDKYALACLEHFRDPKLLPTIDAVIVERQRLAKLENAYV